MQLQEHIANTNAPIDAATSGNGIAQLSTDGNAIRAERLLRNELDQERQKRLLIEIEAERCGSELRMKRHEFEELFQKLHTLERAKEDECDRLRTEFRAACEHKDAQLNAHRSKVAELERNLTESAVQLRNQEALLREFRSRVEVEHEQALQLESTVQQLRSRMQTALRMHVDEKAALLAQLDREKVARTRVHTQATVLEQLTQTSARLSVSDVRNAESLEVAFDELYRRLQRTEAHRRSLAYQKRYMNVLLGNFQQTEEVTLTELARVTGELDDVGKNGTPNRTANAAQKIRAISCARLGDRPKYRFTRAIFLFRSGVGAVIAAHRFMTMFKRWMSSRCPINVRALANGDVSLRSANMSLVQSEQHSRRCSTTPLAYGIARCDRHAGAMESIVNVGANENPLTSYR